MRSRYFGGQNCRARSSWYLMRQIHTSGIRWFKSLRSSIFLSLGAQSGWKLILFEMKNIFSKLMKNQLFQHPNTFYCVLAILLSWQWHEMCAYWLQYPSGRLYKYYRLRDTKENFGTLSIFRYADFSYPICISWNSY